MKYENMSSQEKNGKLYKSSKKLLRFSPSDTLHVAFSLRLHVCVSVCACAHAHVYLCSIVMIQACNMPTDSCSEYLFHK